jgi:hypothetical protein
LEQASTLSTAASLQQSVRLKETSRLVAREREREAKYRQVCCKKIDLSIRKKSICLFLMAGIDNGVLTRDD